MQIQLSEYFYFNLVVIKCYLGFPGSSVVRNPPAKAGNPGSISGLGRSPGEGNGYPLQYSGLENSMDCIVHWVLNSGTWLSNFYVIQFNHLIKDEVWSQFQPVCCDVLRCSAVFNTLWPHGL